MLDAHNAARIRFDDVLVSAGSVLGEVDGARQVLDAVLDIGLFMKRVRTLQELLGDANFQSSRVATLSGY